MTIDRISAVTLLVSDMERSLEFYGKLGFMLSYGGPQASFSSLIAGDGFLNLALHAGYENGGIWGRPIFHVSDVDQVYARAVGAGLEPETQPRDAAWGERYFHILDPDGHEISFARPF